MLLVASGQEIANKFKLKLPQHQDQAQENLKLVIFLNYVVSSCIALLEDVSIWGEVGQEGFKKIKKGWR